MTPNERLKQFQESQKLRLKNIAESLKVDPSTVSRITSGEYKVQDSHAELLKFTHSLNPDWLLHGTEPMYLPQPKPEYSDPRQKELNEAYEFVGEPGKKAIHDTAMKQRNEEEIRVKEQAEYERQHQEDVKAMMENRIIPAEMVEIPIVGYVQAGIPTWTEEVHDGYLTWDKGRISSIENVFWLRIQGTSMVDCGMYPEDCILCDSGVEPRKGDAIVAKVGDEMTVKEYRKITKDGKTYIELIPCNSDFPTLSYPEEEVQIVAVVIANDWRLKRGEKKTWRR